MAGTDRGREPGPGGAQPVMVLVRPQMGENIGAAARAMWNFGLERLRLVAPRDGWPNPRAVAMASGAARVIDAVRISDSTDAAISDLQFVYATTARDRDLTKPVLTPQAAMADAAGRIAVGERVGVLFGPERAGLENADLVRANALVSVPVNPAFGSLNLAQCVLLVAYEWARAQGAALPERPAKAAPASAGEVARLTAALEAQLEQAKFFWPEEKRESLTENLRNLFARMPLTEPDIRTLYGVFRALAERHPAQK